LAYKVLGIIDQIVNPILRGENRRLILGIRDYLLSHLFGSFKSHGRRGRKYGRKNGATARYLKTPVDNQIF